MRSCSCRAPAGVLLTAVVLAAAAENPALPEKMCWAHFCGWGFNVRTTYDEPEGFLRLYDRTLLGSEVGTDLGVASSRREQILEASRYGIDGFCVDIPRLDGYGALGSLYEGAEGLPFKIALCVDGWPGSIDEVVAALATFLTDWGRHPNNYFIDGRPVIFIYQHGRSLADCKAILERLAARGLRAYWLVQPEGETSGWAAADVLQAHLKVFDGLYDFGVNGFPLPQMISRLTNGREALRQTRPTGLLCAGISQGYLGPHNGFYRPYFGTGTLLDNWAAALATNADWVCLCTWNDFWETTHFEPAVWSRDVMLKLNRDLLRQWRGEPRPDRPPGVFLSYKEEVTLGDDWNLDVVSLPYSTDAAACRVRVLTTAGQVIHEFAALPLPRDERVRHTLCLPAPGLEGPRELRLQAAVTTVPAPEPVWRELYPVLIRPGGMRAWRTVRFDLGDLLPAPTLTAAESPAGTRLTATFPSWSWWGRAELLRNGVEIAAQDIAKFGPVDTAISFLVKPEDRRLARDQFVVRLTRRDRRFTTSPPCLLGEYSGEPVTLPVLVRGTDFDEGWGRPHWRSPWRLEQAEVRDIAVPPQEVWRVVLPLDADSGDACTDRGGWQVQAKRGVRDRWGATAPELRPAWASVEVNGTPRLALRFDGENDNVTFPFRTLPPGALTIEFLVRPTKGGPGTLFADQNGDLDVRLNELGQVVVQRQETRLVSADALAAGAWHRLVVVYDYRELRLYHNGALSARGAAPASLRGINSRPVLGALCREGQPLADPFTGELAGFALSARPLTPAEFVLKEEPR
jgi:hypothetical protein